MAGRAATPAEGPSGKPGEGAADTLSFDAVGSGEPGEFDNEDEVTEEDLLDFLAADLDPVPADPVFREKLRETLWKMVSDGQVGQRDDH